MKTFLLLLAAFAVRVDSRNSLAMTPPMGWMSWEIFRCKTDCNKKPNFCISERLYKQTTDAMHDGGFIAAGYTGIHMDDCWENTSRDPTTGELLPDPKRFPRSFRPLPISPPHSCPVPKMTNQPTK